MAQSSTAADAPISIGRIGLKARDAASLAGFYRRVLGLIDISQGDGVHTLGAGGRVLLEIEQFDGARPDDPSSAGLFHTAFLLPTRGDLAAWVRHAVDTGVAVSGASDHLVSEAIYLNDPEGNGIEIYVDRPKSEWPMEGNAVKMATLRLDVPGLVGAHLGQPLWAGAPDGTIVGHVHLRVGDPTVAEKWWRETLGFDTMAKYGPSAVFLATGGYHHHVGANSWQSAGAPKRNPDMAGLAFVELRARDAEDASLLADPWGTKIRVVQAS